MLLPFFVNAGKFDGDEPDAFKFCAAPVDYSEGTI
jgi:hypothetical protein